MYKPAAMLYRPAVRESGEGASVYIRCVPLYIRTRELYRRSAGLYNRSGRLAECRVGNRSR